MNCTRLQRFIRKVRFWDVYEDVHFLYVVRSSAVPTRSSWASAVKIWKSPSVALSRFLFVLAICLSLYVCVCVCARVPSVSRALSLSCPARALYLSLSLSLRVSK